MPTERETKQSAQAMNELYVRSRVFEETQINGKIVKTICRFTIEWTPELPEDTQKELDTVYGETLDHIRIILEI